MKFNKTAEETLAQINSRRYAAAYAMEGKQVVNGGFFLYKVKTIDN